MQLVLTLMLSATLTGCATSGIKNLAFLDTSCKAFRVISYSKSDTEQTKTEIRGHNAAYRAICP